MEIVNTSAEGKSLNLYLISGNFILSGNKCFYLNSNKLNWTAARDHCQDFGQGYDIASIEDLFEQGTATKPP